MYVHGTRFSWTPKKVDAKPKPPKKMRLHLTVATVVIAIGILGNSLAGAVPSSRDKRDDLWAQFMLKAEHNDREAWNYLKDQSPLAVLDCSIGMTRWAEKNSKQEGVIECFSHMMDICHSKANTNKLSESDYIDRLTSPGVPALWKQCFYIWSAETLSWQTSSYRSRFLEDAFSNIQSDRGSSLLSFAAAQMIMRMRMAKIASLARKAAGAKPLNALQCLEEQAEQLTLTATERAALREELNALRSLLTITIQMAQEQEPTIQKVQFCTKIQRVLTRYDLLKTGSLKDRLHGAYNHQETESHQRAFIGIALYALGDERLSQKQMESLVVSGKPTDLEKFLLHEIEKGPTKVTGIPFRPKGPSHRVPSLRTKAESKETTPSKKNLPSVTKEKK